MTLFDNDFLEIKNLLPKEGTVLYFGKIFNNEENQIFYDHLYNDIDWKNDEAIIMGKLIYTKRKVAWHGDKPYQYTYSKRTKLALPWTPTLLKIKEKVEEVSQEIFNSCLLNLYHDGSEGMAWHSDGEKDLKENGAIASVTFGAERKFAFKHKIDKEIIALTLETGSLLIMKDETQKHWLHRLPPTTKIKSPRINLTFRTIVNHKDDN